MRFVLCLLIAFCVCMPAFGASITQLPNTASKGFRVVFSSSDSGTTVVVGPTFPAALVGFEVENGFSGNLYDCLTTVFVADTCDLITALSVDVATLEHQSTRAWYVVVVTTGDASILTIRGTHDSVFSGGAGAFGATSRTVFAATFDGAITESTTDGVNFVQLELDLTEYADSGSNITISSDGNLLCNQTATDLLNVEIHVSGFMQHLATQARNFLVRVGACGACVGTAFPQLGNDDVIDTLTIPATYTVNLDSLSIGISGVFDVFPANSCLGLMAFGEDGREVQMTGGGMSVFEGGGGELAALEESLLIQVENSHVDLTATFGGGGGAAAAVSTAYTQLPMDMTVTDVNGTGLVVSADGNLVCNFTGKTLHGSFTAVMNISQGTGGAQKLELVIGERVGEGPLVDGDESNVVEFFQPFMGSGMNPGQTVVIAGGTQLDGICVGVMVRLPGAPDRAYTVEAGTLFARYNKELI